jgi:4-hydroxythreonine-4-phosphate dehydrogenase
MKPCIGITLGDITGIGPEVTLKALATDPTADDTRFLLIGDGVLIQRLNQKLGLELEPSVYMGPESAGRILITNPLTEPLPRGLRPGSVESAHAAVVWLREGARRCLAGELDALVTAPVSKEAILRAGYRFVGQTEFLSGLAGTERTAMMLLGQDDRDRWLRVVLVTTHVPLKDVPTRITQAKVELAIDLAVQSCRDLGLPRARVAVCGLNPHAGEGGHLGDEESLVVTPAILAAKKKRLDVVGPLSGDTVFHHALRRDYDVVVAMYHDQGLAPLKAVAFDRGVNWTLGLPFIRTSPDHGTAYDIAGRGIANPSSMIAAIRLAKLLARARS